MILCKCGNKLESITGFDSPDEGYAYNLFVCGWCGRICKQNVWNNAGYVWLDVADNLERAYVGANADSIAKL